MMRELTLEHHQHNLKYNLAHEFIWGFGAAFHTVYALVPLFLKELSAPEYITVSSVGIFSIMIAFPTLFSAAFGRNIINIKKAVILAHSPILLVTFMMGFTFLIYDPALVNNAWKIYLCFFILYGISIGIIVPVWTEFINKSTIDSLRGKFLGLGFAFNSLGGLLGGIALKILLLSELIFPKNFGIGFFILFFSLLLGTILFFPFKSKRNKINFPKQTFKSFFFKTKDIIKNHKNFQKYILSRIFYCASLPGMGLYVICYQNKIMFDISEIGTFTIITIIFSAISSYVSGFIGDTYGHKKSMLLAYFAHLCAPLITLFASNILGVYLVFVAVGIGQGSFMPAAMNLVYDFAEHRDSKTYMALIDSLLAPFVLIYLFVIGVLINNKQYNLALIILIISLFIGLIVITLFVKDPKSDESYNKD